MLTSTLYKVIINQTKISVIKIDVCLFKNSLKNFYKVQILYINRQ